MFMGALVYGVRYSIPEYLCTFLVAGGVSVFALFKVNSTRSCSCSIGLAVIG
jgi:UDP-galactose transporter B1